jgi:hypothetical protein
LTPGEPDGLPGCLRERDPVFVQPRGDPAQLAAELAQDHAQTRQLRKTLMVVALALQDDSEGRLMV